LEKRLSEHKIIIVSKIFRGGIVPPPPLATPMWLLYSDHVLFKEYPTKLTTVFKKHFMFRFFKIEPMSVKQHQNFFKTAFRIQQYLHGLVCITALLLGIKV